MSLKIVFMQMQTLSTLINGWFWVPEHIRKLYITLEQQHFTLSFEHFFMEPSTNFYYELPSCKIYDSICWLNFYSSDVVNFAIHISWKYDSCKIIYLIKKKTKEKEREKIEKMENSQKQKNKSLDLKIFRHYIYFNNEITL